MRNVFEKYTHYKNKIYNYQLPEYLSEIFFIVVQITDNIRNKYRKHNVLITVFQSDTKLINPQMIIF